MTILLFVMLGVFVFMMFRRNKKTQQQQAELQSKFGPGVDVMTSFGLLLMFRRNKKTQQQQAELQSKFGPGVDVMTSFGLFGRIVSIDDAENKVVLELSPGNTATVHRQAVTKIVEPVAAAEEPTVVPDDASSLTLGKADTHDAGVTGAAPAAEAPHAETPEETMRRLNDENRKDS